MAAIASAKLWKEPIAQREVAEGRGNLEPAGRYTNELQPRCSIYDSETLISAACRLQGSQVNIAKRREPTVGKRPEDVEFRNPEDSVSPLGRRVGKLAPDPLILLHTCSTLKRLHTPPGSFHFHQFTPIQSTENPQLAKPSPQRLRNISFNTRIVWMTAALNSSSEVLFRVNAFHDHLQFLMFTLVHQYPPPQIH